jgi:anti-sigma factor RsiW
MAIHCGDIDSLCPAFLDGELTGDELDDLEVHLGVCPTCRARVEAERVAQAELRAMLRPPGAPAGLRRDVRALLDREDRAVRAGAGGRTVRWALPAVASLAAAAALAVFVLDASDRPTAPVAAQVSVAAVQKDAVASRFRGGPLVATTSRSEVARSVGEYLRVPVTAPRFTAPAASLRGWQPTRLAGRAAATLRYEVGSVAGGPTHVVDVHMLDARDIALEGSERVVSDGTELWVSSTLGINSVATRGRGGVGYVVVSEMPRGQLLDLVLESDLLANANHRVFGD